MKLFKNDFGGSNAFTGTGNIVPQNLLIAASLTAIFLIGCGPARQEMEAPEMEKTVADSVRSYANNIATDTINGVTHNFIRKAEIRFKVKDVLQSSKKIEDITALSGGYIASSELSSSQNYNTSTRISKDSLLEQTYYTTVNRIRLRVPNQKLDTVLGQISELAIFIDYRNLSSDDVKMKLFSNKLAEDRYRNYKNRVEQKTTKVTTKQEQALNTEENLLDKQTLADQKRVESIELVDQVNYSTVTVDVYQSASYLKQILAAEEKIEPYEPSFLEKAGQAFINGFVVLTSFFLMLINIWGLILMGVVVWWAVRKWKRKGGLK